MLSAVASTTNPCQRYRLASRFTHRVQLEGRPRGPLSAPSRPQRPNTVVVAAAVEVQWNDVVEYVLPQPVAGATVGVGRVEEVTDSRVVLAPLEEEDEEFWVESHDAAPAELPAGSVLRVLECEYSQRQDRDGNPHGEHAHDVYRLLDPPSTGVYRGPRTLKVVLRRAAD